LKGRWAGAKNSERFRCYLCGHRFILGGRRRCIYAGVVKLTNLIVCEACDGTNEEVLKKWQAAFTEYKAMREKFWWAEE